MGIQLVVTSGPDQGRSIGLMEGQIAVIGRGKSAELQLYDARVSRIHCQIRIRAGRVLLFDCNSSGGTFINDKKIDGEELQPGTDFRIGNTMMRLEIADADDDHEIAESDSQLRMVTDHDLDEMVGKTIHTFHIEETLAKGSTGMVFLAIDVENRENVALKVLWPELTQIRDEMRKFVRAMKSMCSLRHPNIVSIDDAGRNGPFCWVAMEYVPGESLADVIGRIGTDGQMDWQSAFRVAVDIASALEAAFEIQIIHRNVTPQNILCRSADNVYKLGDLNLVKALEGSLAEQRMGRDQLLGDTAYMSPERTRSSAKTDCRSDIYSLGATLYTLITGTPPFTSPSLPELVAKIRQDTPVRPKKFQPAIAEMFEDVVMRMLAKRPEDRFQTPTDLLRYLRRIDALGGIEK